MKLTVTNDPQTEYYIVVEEDARIQNEWRDAFRSVPHAELFITGNINEALCAWSRLFINDCLPRCVIAEWDIGNEDVCQIEGNIERAGTHYFMHYCMDLTTEGTFFVYTNKYKAAARALKNDPLINSHVTIARKDKYNVKDALILIRQSPAFIRHTSGFFAV